jgi:hypothetical protein
MDFHEDLISSIEPHSQRRYGEGFPDGTHNMMAIFPASLPVEWVQETFPTGLPL